MLATTPCLLQAPADPAARSPGRYTPGTCRPASTVPDPVRGILCGLPAALRVLPQPGHLVRPDRAADERRRGARPGRPVPAVHRCRRRRPYRLRREPLLQAAFTRAILADAKELGLHTALDTSGYLGTRADDELLDATDLVLLDIKSFDPATPGG